MFNQNGLSLDQAPPISVVLRFFLFGALFGVVGGFIFLLFGASVLNPATKEALIAIHTFTLGVMLSFMFGALFQMLPVIAGVKITTPTRKVALFQIPFYIGVVALLIAFYVGNSNIYLFAGLFLGGSLLYGALLMLQQLFKSQNHSASSKGMTLALISLLFVVILALYMIASYEGLIDGAHFVVIKQAHYSFGLYGWIAMLIAAISFQVIEMFYVTPPYPKVVTKYLTKIILAILVLAFAGGIYNFLFWKVSNIIIALLLSVYATITLVRLAQKKRPISDATVWFWRVGLSALITSMVLKLLSLFVVNSILSSLSFISFAVFAISIVFAMVYKIVPFLTWFHLNAQGYFTAPMMHEVISPKFAKKHLYIHLATIAVLLLSPLYTPLIYLIGLLLILSFGWLLFAIIKASRLYKYTQATGEKFEMNIQQ